MNHVYACTITSLNGLDKAVHNGDEKRSRIIVEGTKSQSITAQKTNSK